MTTPDTLDPPDALRGWTHVESAAETPFDIRVVAVRSHTSLYEDTPLREALRDRTGVDGHGRVCLLGRLVLTPQPPSSVALRTLVGRQTEAAFATRMTDRGFESVRFDSRRSLALTSTTATLSRVGASVDIASLRLAVEGLLALWGARGEYRFVAGVYPTNASGPEPLVSDVNALITPRAYRDELLELIRETESS